MGEGRPLHHGASLHGENAARRQAVTELLFFASVGDLTRCQKICNIWGIQPKDPATTDYDQRSPLHLAAAEGAYSVVQWLIETAGAPVNPVDRFKRTPLEEAVRGDHGEVIALLVSHGAKVMSKEGELIQLSESPLSSRVRIFESLEADWEIDPATLALHEKLGEGEFGVVYLGRWFGAKVAVKVLHETSSVALGDFRTELNVLHRVHHPNTVQFLGAVTRSSPMMIVTDFLVGGSLADLFASGQRLTLRRALAVARDCACGMSYLHGRKPNALVHRDLKPANLIIAGTTADTPAHKAFIVQQVGAVKIADFGLCKSMNLHNTAAAVAAAAGARGGAITAADAASDNSSTARAMSYALPSDSLSQIYIAPEVLRQEPYSVKVDVYSFAMIFFQLLTGRQPFADLAPSDAARSVAQDGARPDWGDREVPEDLRRVVERCWATDAEQRPSFSEVAAALEARLQTMPLTAEVSGAAAAQQSGCCVVV